MHAWVLAIAALVAEAQGAHKICQDGAWTEAPVQAIANLSVLPDVQCWRDPPCVHWKYLRPETCARLRANGDWPTKDPFFVTAPAHSVPDLVRRFLQNKTLFVTGNSIGNLVFRGLACELAKHYTTRPVRSAAEGSTARVSAFFREVQVLKDLNLQGAGTTHFNGSVFSGGPPADFTLAAEPDLLLVRKGWGTWKATDMAAQMRLADVIVVNYGLHYLGERLPAYESDMRALFQQLQRHAARPGRASVFLETTAGHEQAPVPGGGPEHGRMVKPCACSHATSAEGEGVRRMNALVASLRAEFPAVQLIELTEAMKNRGNLYDGAYPAFEAARHSGRLEENCDCVNFCYTPQLFQHLASELYAALERSHAYLK